MDKIIRPIAIYLPQFHPFKENNDWWGKGFTEWTNVVKARPCFKGQYQPHLPADLGFYDLRVPEIREQQAELAKTHGIHGFCYYHYWFNGHRLMERPLNDVLESGNPDFPFMLCWANENWTRTWSGNHKDILIEQKYSEDDDLQHIRYLLENVFSDPRYIRVNNKPVFCIYRSTLFPNIKRTIELWRKEALKNNIELYICRFESFASNDKSYLEDGFDAAIDFQPSSRSMQEFIDQKGLLYKILHKANTYLFNRDKNKIIDYQDYANFMCDLHFPSYKQYPSITPMWDNAARRKKAFFAMKNSTPDSYAKWLKSIVNKFEPYSKDENFIFINAWNEWAEGNHLEPDQKWGYAYLKATKNILENKK